MGLLVLVIGLILFIGPHVFVTMRPQRDALVKQMGLWPYKIAFAVVSLVSLYVMAVGFGMYRSAGVIEIWDPPIALKHIAKALVLVAFIMVAAAYVPGDIKRVLKHPMLVGVKTWAVAHLIANGDLGGIILFGSILAWAVYDRISLKHRSDPGGPPIPIGGWKNDVAAVIVGIILFAAFALLFHPIVVGIPVFGTPAYGT